MNKIISVLIINLNNLNYTKDCIKDLMKQDCNFNLMIVDQNSNEEGTKEYFDSLLMSELPKNIEYFRFYQNTYNKPINHIWNWFAEIANTKYLCMLNNDVKICPNFLSSAIEVLELEPNIAIVNHVTNNANYSKWSEELDYKIEENIYRQGWDFIIRKEHYNEIPKELEFFFGDDYIYSTLYTKGYKGAYVLNSPMIHYECSTTEEKGGKRDLSNDRAHFEKLNLEHKNMNFSELSKWNPEFEVLQKKNFEPKITLDEQEFKQDSKLKLSILICSLLERRKDFLDRLLNILEPQIIDKNVEIIIISDNAKRSIGQKRNNALNMANGEYVCFIDDDDLISDNYVDSILEKMENNPDVIVFDAQITFDGNNPKLVKYGREYEYMEKDEAYYRQPNHLMVHKKSNITEFFKDVKTGEDDEWATRMLDRIVTQERINKILYFYDFKTTTKKYFN